MSLPPPFSNKANYQNWAGHSGQRGIVGGSLAFQTPEHSNVSVGEAHCTPSEVVLSTGGVMDLCLSLVDIFGVGRPSLASPTSLQLIVILWPCLACGSALTLVLLVQLVFIHGIILFLCSSKLTCSLNQPQVSPSDCLTSCQSPLVPAEDVKQP